MGLNLVLITNINIIINIIEQAVPRNPLTRWDVSSIPANGIFLTKKLKKKLKKLGLCIDTDIRRYIDRYDIIYLSAERFCRYLDIYRRRYMRYIGVFPHC